LGNKIASKERKKSKSLKVEVGEGYLFTKKDGHRQGRNSDFYGGTRVKEKPFQRPRK